MYRRRYTTAQEEKSIVRVPENYVGNAFREDIKEEDADISEQGQIHSPKPDCQAECDTCQKKDGASLLPFFNTKILSSDTLLLLLAFLLMGNGECEDLPGILIFLMLL